MEFDVKSGSPAKQRSACIVVAVFEPRKLSAAGEEIDEASGVAFSTRFPDRVYHVNDSGGEMWIYSTNLAGSVMQKVRVTGYNPQDVEDLRVANCGNGAACLFIADIGDNDRQRKTIEIVVVAEPARMSGDVAIRKRVQLRYPDGAHDSESFVIHPDGTFLLFTKDGSGSERLFTLSKEEWQNGVGLQTLKARGSVNFRSILPDTDTFGVRPTSMDVSPDGRRLLVLTYRDAVEFSVDLNRPFPLTNPRRLHLEFLMQQEAVAYTRDGTGFIYSTEELLLPAWIMEGSCPK